MKFKISKRLTALAAAVATAVTMLSIPVAAQEEEAQDVTTIKIFHTNDVHARYDGTVNENGTLDNFGYGRLKTVIQQNTAPEDNVLVFDAGDTFHGLPFATVGKGEGIAKLMKIVGYDAMVSGNHDFNYGYERTAPLAQEANVTLLGANVKESSTGSIAKGFTAYTTYNFGDVKVGVFGLATPETATKTNPRNVQGLYFDDPVKTAEKMVDILTNVEKADVIICLAHLGIDKESAGMRSTDVAEQVKGIDLIIDGHSHTMAADYPKMEGTVITSTGEYMESIGMVTLKVDQDKNVSIQADSILASETKASDCPPNFFLQAAMRGIMESQKSTLNKVIAKTDIFLDGAREHVRTGETNLSRLLTSAMLAETGADVALTNGGGIRASIPAGNITVGAVQTVLPFGNYIVTVKLTGSELRQAVEFGLPGLAENGLEVMGKKIQVAGLQVVYNPALPQGKRIVSITHNGRPLEDDKVYTVATNDFMASGGDGYTMLAKSEKVEFEALDECLIGYLGGIGTDGINTINNETRIRTVK